MNIFVAMWRDKAGTERQVSCESLDDAIAVARAHLERIHDAVSAEVQEYEPMHKRPKTMAECHESRLVCTFAVAGGDGRAKQGMES